MINLKWREKYKLLQNFHKTYDEIKTIAFNSEQTILVNFVSTVLEVVGSNSLNVIEGIKSLQYL